MKSLHLGAAVALALGFAAFAAPSASASVTVLGGGLAEECSKLAIRGINTVATLETCEFALEHEDLIKEDRAKTYVNRAVIYLRRGQMEQCRKDLAAAERLTPELPETYINRGALYIFQRRYADSITEIDKGIALNPEEPEKAYFNRGLAKEGLNDARGAYLDYRKAAQINPEWPDARKAMARFQVTTRER